VFTHFSYRVFCRVLFPPQIEGGLEATLPVIAVETRSVARLQQVDVPSPTVRLGDPDSLESSESPQSPGMAA
jgi:hypothetical protein